ncbi:MAG: zinc-dependent alcohol dehydrogenase family protein [Thermoleophilia bacterium]
MVLTRPAPAGRGPLEATTRPLPQPGAGELLLRMSACGVCRTDLQLCEGDLEARRLPVVPGHQAVGRVTDVGPGVEGWAVGDRVGAYWLAGTCGTCRFCRDGRENLCERGTFTGWDRDGGFAEAMLVSADAAVRLPDGVEDVDAAPLLCGGVIGYRALRRSGIRPGGRLGLFGFGASALCAIQIAVHWGCEVFVHTRSAQERERALALGAVWAGEYTQDTPVPLDAAVTFAPVGWVVTRALAALDRGGTVAVNAIHLDRIPEFPYEDLWWERNVVSVANVTRADAAEFMALAAEIPVRTSSRTYPLRDANRALADLAAGEVPGAAVLVMEG